MRCLVLTVLVAVLVAGLVAGAGYSVTVNVYMGGQPVDGATIKLYNGTSLVANATTINGTASFLNISSGNYTVEITIGNNTYTYNITVDANHTVFTFNITTTTTTATGNDTASDVPSVTDRLKEWWSSLDLKQKAAIVVAGLIVLFILAKRVV